MKKFLFTLVALLAAGSMFANEYCFIEDQDLTAQAGQEVELTLQAHFDYAVSAIQCDFTFPEGMTFVDCIQGADTKIDYYTSTGRLRTSNPLFIADFDNNNFMCAQADQGYYQVDGAWVTHNVVKWAPGDYEEMAILVVELADDFAGGKITILTQPSCDSGQDDPREDYPNCPEGQENTTETNVGPQETPMLDCAAPVISYETLTDKVVVTVTWNESDGEKVYTGLYEYVRPEYGQPDESYDVEAYTMASATYNASPKATATIPVPAKDPVWQDVAAPVISYETGDDVVTVTIEWPTTTGEHVYTGQYTYTRPEAGQPDESYDVEAYTLADYPYNASPKAQATIPVPAKEPVVIPQTAKPTITPVTNEDGSVTVTVTGEGTLHVLIEGYDLELDVITYTGPSPYVITLQQAEEAQEIVVSATAQKENELESEPAIAQFEIEAKPYVPVLLTGEIEFSAVNQENGQFTVTYTGNEEGVIITLNDETITLVAGKGTTTAFQLPTYGTYPVVATAKAIGYDNEITGEATLVWEAPVTPELPAVPEITINMDDNNVYVGATTQEGATTTLYQVTYDDEGNEILTPINNPQAFARGVENYEVKVKAVAENAAGESWSEVITIPVPSGTTGINEMIDGKAIANVRYFNMAGQEMTEANGVTIVVTTYTDGTTSAVKVMK